MSDGKKEERRTRRRTESSSEEQAKSRRKLDTLSNMGEYNFSRHFIREMRNNMWEYINMQVLKFILQKMGLPKKVKFVACAATDRTKALKEKNALHYENLDSEEEKYTRYRIDRDIPTGENLGGHYYYSDNTGSVWGSYEREILNNGDDGICHGVASIYTLMGNGLNEGVYISPSNERFPFKFYINSKESRYKRGRAENYINILKFYLFLLESGLWELAMENYFYSIFFDAKTGRMKKTKKEKMEGIIEKLKSEIKYLQSYLDREIDETDEEIEDSTNAIDEENPFYDEKHDDPPIVPPTARRREKIVPSARSPTAARSSRTSARSPTAARTSPKSPTPARNPTTSARGTTAVRIPTSTSTRSPVATRRSTRLANQIEFSPAPPNPVSSEVSPAPATSPRSPTRRQSTQRKL